MLELCLSYSWSGIPICGKLAQQRNMYFQCGNEYWDGEYAQMFAMVMSYAVAHT